MSHDPRAAADLFWVREGRGQSPIVKWTFRTDGQLNCMALARESGDIFLGDESGALHRLDRTGKISALSRFPSPPRLIAWSDAGRWGAVITEDNLVRRVDRRFQIDWEQEVQDDPLGLAISPFGHHIAVSLVDSITLVYNERQKRLARFETIRPLSFLQFCGTEPLLFACAEHGLLCCHNLVGAQLWQEKVWSNCGDLRVTGAGDMLYLAGFGHGIQAYNGDGKSLGSYMLEGTVNKLAVTFEAHRVLASTIERFLYWLDADGELLWATGGPSDVVGLACDPSGDWAVIGFRDGLVVRLNWGV